MQRFVQHATFVRTRCRRALRRRTVGGTESESERLGGGPGRAGPERAGPGAARHGSTNLLVVDLQVEHTHEKLRLRPPEYSHPGPFTVADCPSGHPECAPPGGYASTRRRRSSWPTAKGSGGAAEGCCCCERKGWYGTAGTGSTAAEGAARACDLRLATVAKISEIARGITPTCRGRPPRGPSARARACAHAACCAVQRAERVVPGASTRRVGTPPAARCCWCVAGVRCVVRGAAKCSVESAALVHALATGGDSHSPRRR
jgi:hypothetical protein